MSGIMSNGKCIACSTMFSLSVVYSLSIGPVVSIPSSYKLKCSRSHCEHLKCRKKLLGGWGSTPDSTGGSHPLAGGEGQPPPQPISQEPHFHLGPSGLRLRPSRL